MDRKYVIVFSETTGVHVGFLVSYRGRKVTLSEARRVFLHAVQSRYFSALDVEQLAQDGGFKGAMLSAIVSEMTLLRVDQILSCSDDAKKALREAKATTIYSQGV